MKTFRVTVNGNVYDVTVEETDGQILPPVLPATPAPVATTPAPATPAAPLPPAPAASADASPVKSPLPGTVLDIKVAVGDIVSINQAVVLLEAMKMENDIITPVAGKVASIMVAKGAAVETGAVLLTVIPQ